MILVHLKTYSSTKLFKGIYIFVLYILFQYWEIQISLSKDSPKKNVARNLSKTPANIEDGELCNNS